MGVALALLTGALAVGQPGREFYRSFRGVPIDPVDLQVVGTQLNNLARTEGGGLRVRLPAGQPKLPPVGVRTCFQVRGDFEITAGFQLVNVASPQTGHGAGVSLYLELEGPGRPAATVARYRRPKDGDVFVAHRARDADGEREHHSTAVPARGSAGALRLVRRGPTVEFLVSEDHRLFVAVDRFDIGPGEVRLLRLAGENGGGKGAVDVRLTDLRVRGGSLPNEAPPPPAPSRAPLYWVGAALLLLAAGAWWRTRNREE